MKQTNLYVASKLNVTYEVPENPRLKEWRDVILDEMKVCLALTINMGFVRKDNFREYWSTDCEVSTPYFSKNMNVKRIESIFGIFTSTTAIMMDQAPFST